jgi:hypothetical protein
VVFRGSVKKSRVFGPGFDAPKAGGYPVAPNLDLLRDWGEKDESDHLALCQGFFSTRNGTAIEDLHSPQNGVIEQD